MGHILPKLIFSDFFLSFILKVIKDFMNTTNYNRYGEPMKGDTTILLYSLLVAIFAVGGMVGGLLAGWWATFFGR